MRRLALGACVLLIALLPIVALAVSGGGYALRARGPFTLPVGESTGSAVVIGDDATIGGAVRDNLVVINGHAEIAGRVEGNLIVVRGDATLEAGSRVGRVTIINGGVTRETGSIIDHGVNERSLDFMAGWPFWRLWLGITLVVLTVGTLAAAVAGPQLARARSTLTGAAAHSAVGALALWVGLVALAVVAFLTVVGTPLALAIVVLLPLIWLAGYVVAGSLLGRAILRFWRPAALDDNSYLVVASGLLVLQIIALVPVIGWLIAAVAGSWGAGAIAVTAVRASRGRRQESLPVET